MLFFQFCVLRMGIKVGRLAFVFFMMNWFTLYCSARTISNQTEMSLNIMCLWYLQTSKLLGFNFHKYLEEIDNDIIDVSKF